MPDATDTSAPEASAVVAESYPPLPAVTPVRTWRIHWLLAFPAALVALVFPRRLGPHLAASSWAAAYVAHVLSAVLYWGALSAVFVNISRLGPSLGSGAAWPALSLSERLREPLAALVLAGYELSANWPMVVSVAIGVLVVEAGLWLAAVTLIPMYAAGEGRAQVYLRAVKLLLWSSVCAVLLGYAITALVVWFTAGAYAFMPEQATVALLLLWTVWWLSVLLRLGGRYGGPPQGPGWEQRALRCEACGYALTMQPVTGRCPECGRAVANSLREGRQPSAFAAAKGLVGLIGYWRTVWRSLRARRFAERTCVRQGQRSARRFAYLTCALVGLLVAAAGVPHVLGGESIAGFQESY